MEIKVANLDEILQNPDNPSKERITIFEANWLRDLKAIIVDSGLKAGTEFALDKASPRLWKELAVASLQALDFEKANAAFVHSQDYQGLQFIKRLKKIEVSVFVAVVGGDNLC